MQQEITESVQGSILAGEMVDTFYYGETNIQKQAYPCIANTRFVQNFTNLGAGSSQFVISPNQGVSDIVLQLQMPTTMSGTNLSLPNSWGYGLLNRVSVRYGSSGQFFWTGAQILLQNMYDAETNQKVDQLASLGGNYATGAACVGASALVYLKLPHNSIRADGKPLPFPSDLLVQPIVITVELLAPSAVFVSFGASVIPAALGAAQMQVKQEILSDNSDLLARRVDMNQNAYTFPLPYFCQQEVQVLCQNGGAQSVNLTGFRGGEVKSILLWLTLNSQTQSTVWYPLTSVTLTYNGEIFSRFDGSSSQLWNLLQDSKSAQLNTSVVNTSTGAATAYVSQWTECQFSQVCLPYDKEVKNLHGKPILNAVVNLQFSCPDASAYTLHAMYLYNASLLCSRGSSEYIF